MNPEELRTQDSPEQAEETAAAEELQEEQPRSEEAVVEETLTGEEETFAAESGVESEAESDEEPPIEESAENESGCETECESEENAEASEQADSEEASAEPADEADGGEEAPDGESDSENADAETAETDEDIPADEAVEEEEPRFNPGKAILGFFRRLAIWLVLVALLLAALVGGTMYMLYRDVDESSIPLTTVTFDGQEVAPVSGSWTVPVIGPLNRHFGSDEEENSPSFEHPNLGTIITANPELTVSGNFETSLTIVDDKGEVVFEGAPEAFERFSFTKNGTYTVLMAVRKPPAAQGKAVEGVHRFMFDFTLSAQPVLTLSRSNVSQGSVFTLTVSGSLGELAPILTTEFGSGAAFVPWGNKWVAVVDVPLSVGMGNYALNVTCGDYRMTESVHVYGRPLRELDTNSLTPQGAVPYIGAMPDGLQEYMNISDPDLYWASGFEQPVKGTLERDFYVNEYLDRITDPMLIELVPELVAELNAQIQPRLSVNATYSLPSGTKVKCPADGRVLYSGYVNGGGKCLVIEHGCGLKSIFYLLASVYPEEGDFVYKGDEIASTNHHVICEMRMNGNPISPWDLWRNMGALAIG